jgi:hypothetical protein
MAGYFCQTLNAVLEKARSREILRLHGGADLLTAKAPLAGDFRSNAERDANAKSGRHSAQNDPFTFLAGI